MQCFVIMPFGEKADPDGKPIDFDLIYKSIIKPSVEKAGCTSIRCDEIVESGMIHSMMFEKIYNSPVAVVDITLLNPNVFYELGVRHALANFVTVIVRRKGTKLPFNVQDLHIIEYDDLHSGSDEEAKQKLVNAIGNGLKSRKVDSPVHTLLTLKIGIAEPSKIEKLKIFEYKLHHNLSKRVCLVTGDLENIKNLADIWVSSENTNMQMARYYDRSVSGVIRYLGAKKGRHGHVVDDTIAKELASIVGKVACRFQLKPAALSDLMSATIPI